ncbi:MAG TPA: transposase [Rhodothermales bacterium]
MAKRQTNFYSDGYYHLYNRGAGRNLIFFEHANYRFMLKYVLKYADEHDHGILAYCLMPNHYHFLLHQRGDIPAGRTVQLALNRYTKTLNRRYGRSGTLFEGPYRAKEVNTLAYLRRVCAYIHANPAKAGLVRKPEQWMFSNYRQWIEKGRKTRDERQFIRTHFLNGASYKAFVDEMLDPNNAPRWDEDRSLYLL